MPQKQSQGTASGCLVCEEAITNPICPDCLSKRMYIWLSEENPALAHHMARFNTAMRIGEYEEQTADESMCLFCGRTMMVCAHCCSKDMYEALVEKDAVTADAFVKCFDFELRNELLK